MKDLALCGDIGGCRHVKHPSVETERLFGFQILSFFYSFAGFVALSHVSVQLTGRTISVGLVDQNPIFT